MADLNLVDIRAKRMRRSWHCNMLVNASYYDLGLFASGVVCQYTSPRLGFKIVYSLLLSPLEGGGWNGFEK